MAQPVHRAHRVGARGERLSLVPVAAGCWLLAAGCWRLEDFVVPGPCRAARPCTAALLHAMCLVRNKTGPGRSTTCALLVPMPGSQNWDGTGGTGAALKHYEATGKK